ncbi:MAG: magnesium transporter CorA [Lachnospiraceae bacterium]|nr:magnesium transporter CorA [Lachnospiraceae bacterium]
MYYLIDTILKECSAEECHSGTNQYVAVLTPEEWNTESDSYDMGIDMEPDTPEIYTTKAEVNYDSVTGTFAIPDRNDMSGEYIKFSFALDEKGVVFIDANGTVSRKINKILNTKKWRFPSLERFIYDFLEQMIHEDPRILENYERKLDIIDNDIDCGKEGDLDTLNDIRGYLRDLRTHYNQLMDLAQEFEENENSFFQPDHLRFFRLFSSRVSRLHEMVNSLLDYTNQIRDTYQSRLDVKQNRIMTVLTVVTTIFMPLTLIVGWYGMNFKYMPELDSVWGYPVVIIVSLLIVISSLLFFKRKKWL